MAYKTMTFSRESSGYNAEDGGYLDFVPDSSLSFGSLYKCTDFYAEITGGITSATTSARTHEMKLQLKLGSTWRTIWEGEMYLPAKGTTGYDLTFSGTIPSAYQATAATNGVADIRLQQAGDYALRGANATGSIEITYVENVTNCGAPSGLTLSATQAAGGVTLSWSAGTAGTNNTISGYLITYQDSADGSTWGEVDYYGEATGTSMTVYPPDTAGYYRRFGVQTMGAAGEGYYSSVVWSGSLQKAHAPLPSFTDTIVAGMTPVKALHITELQTAVNELRKYYGLSIYTFAPITDGATSLAGWSKHVAEIRTAVDEIANKAGKTHEAWIAFSVNCPRADVVEQLRSVVLAL